jgi:hypothetical protein
MQVCAKDHMILDSTPLPANPPCLSNLTRPSTLSPLKALLVCDLFPPCFVVVALHIADMRASSASQSEKIFTN